MKMKTILFSSLLFFISQYVQIQAMFNTNKCHSLDHIGEVVYKNFSGDKNSIFIAPPELFTLAPDKRAFIEFIQKNPSQRRPTNPSNSPQEKTPLLEAKK